MNNRAVDGAGLRVLGNLAITNSQFIANIAGNNGGAIDWFNGPGTNGRIVDSLFARNSSGGGAALRLDGGGALAILFTTVADSSLNSGTAIAVSSGTVGITDSIIFNFAVGISQTGGTVREDYNLFFGNTNDRLGTITIGSHSFDLNPAFINPATDNYHLGPLSAAIDQGVDAGVYVDFDGDTRPIGAGFDIGFDERNAAAFKLYLPLIMR